MPVSGAPYGEHQIVLPEPFDESLKDAPIDLEIRLEMFRKQHQIR